MLNLEILLISLKLCSIVKFPEKSQAENNACINYSTVRMLSNQVLVVMRVIEFNRIDF